MRTVIGFTVVYTLVLFFYGISVDSPLVYTYAGITVLIFVTFAVMHRYARFSRGVLWSISLVGLVNMIGGVLLVDGEPLYIAGSIGPLPFDKFFHAAAAFAFIFVAWHAMTAWAGHGYSFGGLLTLTFLVVMGGGAVVEIAELIGTTISDVSVGDYGNNALDLVANAVGAALGLVIVWRRHPGGAADAIAAGAPDTASSPQHPKTPT